MMPMSPSPQGHRGFHLPAFLGASVPWRRIALPGAALVGAAAAANALIGRGVRPLANTLGGTEGWFDWRGHRIAHTVHGEGSPVLLVHGVHPSAWSDEWSGVIETLARHHRVYTIDLLGFGRSARPARRYSAGLYLALVADFARRVIGEPTALVATGLSAAWAIQLGARDPGRFPALYLLGPAGLGQTEEEGSPLLRRLTHLALRTPILGTALFNAMVTRGNLRAFLRQGFAARGAVTDALVDAHHAAAHQPGSRHAPAALLAGRLDVTVREPLRRLVQPTAIVWGEHARLVPLEGARAFRAARPDLELTVLDHAGDFPHVERAVEVAEGIVAFLKRAGHWKAKTEGAGTGRAA